MVAGHLREKSGYYYAVLNYTDPLGKRKTKWISTGLTIKGNKKKAEAVLMDARRNFVPETPKVMSGDIMFADFMEKWLEVIKSSVAVPTFASYSTSVKKIIAPYFREKEITLKNLTAKDIQEFYLKELERVSASSVIHYHANIHKALKYAVKIDLIDSNPADKVERPKKDRFIGSFYDADEVNALLQASKGTKLEMPILFGSFYGLRRSEVINPKTNPSCFDEFFSVSSVFQDTHIMFNEVASSNVKENSLVSFGENYRIKRKFEFLKLFMSMSGKLDERYVSRLVKESKRSYYDLYKELRLHTAISSVMHPQGPCIPGIVRLFVNVNGEFFPCEKVPELAYSCIGNIDNGFDIERIKQVMNIGRLSEKECKSCWAVRLCSCCLNDIECHNCTIDCQSKLAGCGERKNMALSNLFDITVLSENGFELPLEEE